MDWAEEARREPRRQRRRGKRLERRQVGHVVVFLKAVDGDAWMPAWAEEVVKGALKAAQKGREFRSAGKLDT